MNSDLTTEEIAAAASILAKLEPGYLPQQLFDQINRLHVASTVVIVPLKHIGGQTNVLLVQRGNGTNEPVWPDHWHLPGTMLRPSDKEGDYSDAFHRILSGELGDTPVQGKPVFMRTFFTHTKRGRELTQVFRVEVTGEPKAGAFFPIDQLPAPRIEHEIPYIHEAARAAKH